MSLDGSGDGLSNGLSNGSSDGLSNGSGDGLCSVGIDSGVLNEIKLNLSKSLAGRIKPKILIFHPSTTRIHNMSITSVQTKAHMTAILTEEKKYPVNIFDIVKDGMYGYGTVGIPSERFGPEISSTTPKYSYIIWNGNVCPYIIPVGNLKKEKILIKISDSIYSFNFGTPRQLFSRFVKYTWSGN
jgi:hypothetical protein